MINFEFFSIYEAFCYFFFVNILIPILRVTLTLSFGYNKF